MSLLERRRALMSQSREKYVFVEYIESTGTQFITTDLYFKSEYDVDFEFSVSNFPTKAGVNIYLWTTNNASLDPNWHYQCNWGTDIGQKQYLGWKYYASTYAGITMANAEKNTKTRVYTKGNYWYEDVLWGFSNNGTNKMTSGKIAPVPLKLFGSYSTTNNGIFNMCNLRFYYFKVTENGTVVANLVPCYRKADQKVGMYDTENDKFYINNGTGEFLIGGEL